MAATVELAYAEFGPKLGKPLLFVHGFPYDRRMWQAQADFLAQQNYRIVVPDLRGMGKSPVVKEPGTIQAYVQDLVALCDKLSLGTAVVLGFSLGGYVALEFARAHPDRLRALALIDTRAEADSDEGKKGRNETIEKVRKGGSAVLKGIMVPKMLTERTRKAKPDLVALVERIIGEQPQEGVVRALEALRDRPDQRPNLAKIRVPTLIVVGAEDPLTPVAASMEMQKQIPNAQLRIITGAAHLSPMEAVEPINHFLDDWLKNLDAPQMPKTGIQRLGLKVEGGPKPLR
jgi:pimeloyl-ACP methyl ester carboxylesterase